MTDNMQMHASSGRMQPIQKESQEINNASANISLITEANFKTTLVNPIYPYTEI